MNFLKTLQPGDIVRLRNGRVDVIVPSDATKYASWEIKGANNNLWRADGTWASKGTDMVNYDIVEVVVTAKQLKKLRDETTAIDLDAGYEAFMLGQAAFYEWLER
jgi:hypothetical protein